MTPIPPVCGPVRSAAVVNEDIRALLERTRRRLSDVERAEYEQLLNEYAAARLAEVTTAA